MAYRSVLWTITNHCNFSCAYCSVAQGKREPMQELTYEQIRDHLVPALLEARVLEVNIFGGEPTVRSDFLDIVQLLRANCLGVSFVTNGSLLTPELCAKLNESHLDRIYISFDSYLPNVNAQSRISKQDYFPTIVGAIKYFAQHPSTVLYINTVVNSLNYRTIPQLIDFLAELGVKHVHLLRESRTEDIAYAHPAIQPTDLLELALQMDQKQLQYPQMEIASFFLPLKAKAYLNKYYGTHFKCEQSRKDCLPGVNSIDILADGTVIPCKKFDTKSRALADYFELDGSNKVTVRSIAEICKSSTFQKAFVASRVKWYRQSMRPCGQCEFLDHGCSPCMTQRLETVLVDGDWKPIVYDSVCQHISTLEQEKWNDYQLAPELMWYGDAGVTYLYNPGQSRLQKLSGYSMLVCELVIQGYIEEEIVKIVFQKYPTQFAHVDECRVKIDTVIHDLIKYGFLSRSQ